MIEIKQVNKVFHTKSHDVQALKDVSLSIDKGDIYGIIGFSGAGKSTLIRCMNAIETIDSGEVIVDGKNLFTLSNKDLREMRKKIGMIFQQFNLMNARTVYENIAFPLQHSSLSKEEKKAKINDLLQLVELEDKANVYPSQLSGGQKQRVAIARALANDPQVLLCDEATSALDPQTTKSILNLLKKLNETLHLTIVLITHEMAVVKAICHHVAIMEDGCIVEQGKMLDVFANPQANITKSFIETTSGMNKVKEMIAQNDPLLSVSENERLYHFLYTSSSSKEGLLSEMVKRYDISFNMIYGDVDFVDGLPIGNLVLKLKGAPEVVEEAIAFVKADNVKVEVLA